MNEIDREIFVKKRIKEMVDDVRKDLKEGFINEEYLKGKLAGLELAEYLIQLVYRED